MNLIVKIRVITLILGQTNIVFTLINNSNKLIHQTFIQPYQVRANCSLDRKFDNYVITQVYIKRYSVTTLNTLQ